MGRDSSGRSNKPSLLPRLAFPTHLSHDRDEHILQRVHLLADISDMDSLSRQSIGNALSFSGGIFVHNDVQTIAKQGHAPAIHLAFEQIIRALRSVGNELDYVPLLFGFQS